MRRLIAALLLVLLSVAGAGGVMLWLTLPARHERVRVPGLSAAASVTMDGNGIPRIRAASALDAATVLGFLHARDRMAQMELTRRAASGRLAELVGPSALPYDRMMRVLGLQHLAEADAASLSPDLRALFEAYARGVNAWIAGRGRFAAPEALALGRPAPWRPADSLLWGRMLALWLSGNYRAELTRLALSAHMPPAQALALWPAHPGLLPADAARDARSDVPPGTGPAAARHAQAGPAGDAATLLAALPAFPAAFAWPAEASQEWALDGRHTATGAPLLAGDPHLALGFPGIWYLARIDTPDGVLAGATAPGVPFLVIGHNGHIAWSFTTASVDTEDLFRETVLPDGRYATPDGPRAFDTRVERIAVRGAPDELLTVRSTRHGPVISDLDPAGAAPDRPVLALQAEALGPASAGSGLLALDRARDVDAAGAAAALVSTPVQNLLVADRDRIALFTTGRVPVRRAGDGAMPVAGADGAHDWVADASGAALPRFVAPAGGRLVNANESVVGPGFPVFLDRDSDPDWRALRIRTRLDALAAAGDRATVADFAAMQADDGSAYAAALLPALLPTLVAVRPPPGLAARAAALLKGWDGTMDPGLPQPLIFNAWMQRLAADLLSRQGVPPGEGGAWEDITAQALGPGGTAWCGRNGCNALLTASLAAAAGELGARYGDDPASWRWGTAHRAVFGNALLARLPLLGWLTTHRISVPGDDTTLFRGGSGTLGDFAARHGAGYRGVYDLADLDRSRFMIAPGESGNPLSAHAWNMLDAWARGATITLGPTPDRVTATVRLAP